MTGVEGYCSPGDGFNGSLHVCLDMTLEYDVKGVRYMCHDGPRYAPDGKLRMCPVKNWCIDEWKFALEVQERGCVALIRCEATSMMARAHYMLYGKSTPG